MSKLFPEQPILFYPSLALRFGVEEAILLSVYHQYALHHGALNAQGIAQFVLRRHEWLALVPFFDEEKLAQLTSSLVSQWVLDAQFQANGSIRILVLDSDAREGGDGRLASSPPALETADSVVPVSPNSSPLFETPLSPNANSSSRPFMKRVPPAAVVERSAIRVRGPAPSFGGSTGWARPKDDLELLFERQELHHQQLKEITPNWQPQQDTLQLLAKKSITDQFSLACADQFVAYYMGQGQRKKSWEQPFMKWVMREWVDAQKKQYQERTNKDQQGFSGERDQAHSRSEKRQRITESLLDIKNTDW